ncbi:MAG TPA: methylmalonyl Co-A mutase-associated GTPase MeaB [Thermoplasmata archaeon]|nr:methylmalonyl Co-A mutase-associated GTPase MeaB [Thermoplasmata archaeon]
MPASALARAVSNGDRRALAQLISAVEDGDPKILPVLEKIYPKTGHARVVGITGPLGVGKSSLINLLLAHLRSQGIKVGIVAVDPSSPFTGGSVLGDRIRLERRAGDDGVFIRSMASRGHAGGVAATTREVVRLLDAFGMDVVLVETVGSGQVDVEVREVASTSVVVLVPHLGDEVQTLKAGLFEIADVFCLNKSDLPGADSATRDLHELVGIGTPRDGWRPTVVATSAVSAQGIPELWEQIDAHERWLDQKGTRAARERERLAREMVGLVSDRVGAELTRELVRNDEFKRLLDEVVARDVDPHRAAERLYGAWRRGT